MLFIPDPVVKKAPDPGSATLADTRRDELCPPRILYHEEGDLVWEKETIDMGNRPAGNIITAATHHLPAIESFHLFEKEGRMNNIFRGT